MPETSAQQTCPHGLRPGTTVCLHCRQDARNAARQRRYQLLARAGVVVLGGALVVALIVGGIQAIRPSDRAEPTSQDVAAAVTVAEPSARPVSGAPSAEPALLPIIPEGRQELGEGMYAVREGRQVTVHFDTDLLRTRYDWKFEGVVRATLPAVYGQEVRTALDSIAVGTWVGGGDLMTELPQQGIALELPKGAIRIFPITRQGRDGPLVVAYRAVGAR